jgi:hypothetical protein
MTTIKAAPRNFVMGDTMRRSVASTHIGCASGLLTFRLRRLRWYVFGAQAVVVHGRPRMTGDVDVTVEIDVSRLPSLIRPTQALFDNILIRPQ